MPNTYTASCACCGGPASPCGCPTRFIPRRLFVLIHYSGCSGCSCSDVTVPCDWNGGTWEGVLDAASGGHGPLRVVVQLHCGSDGLGTTLLFTVVVNCVTGPGDCTYAPTCHATLDGPGPSLSTPVFRCGDTITGLTTGGGTTVGIIGCSCTITFTVSS